MVVFFSIVSNFPAVIAQDYFADINIIVDESGFVTIDGTTNHPDLLEENTELYTSKKQSYWLINITKEEIFSDFIFSLSLPSGSSINYVKSSGFIIIKEDFGKLIVKGFGQNKSLSILIQYQVEKASGIIQSYDITISLIIFFIGLVVIFLLINRFYKKRLVTKTKSINEESKTEYNLSGLSARQKEIMKILIDKKRPLTQTEIQNELHIPKAAVSRNINSLERKDLVEREKSGMSNLIRLKKP